MARITIYRNKDCARCAKIARMHKRFDWLDRVAVSTDLPPTGQPLRMGEIVVVDARSGEVAHGVEAVRAIFRQIPAYVPLRPFLRVPFIARRVDAEVRGCDDGACAVS